MEGKQVSGALRMAALAAGVLLVAPGSPEADEGKERVGYAYSLESGNLLYKEIHNARMEAGKPATEQVIYRGPDGEVVAAKTIDYQSNPIAPDFQLDMRGTKYQEGLRTIPEGREVYYRPTNGEGVRRVVLDGRSLVADAGFDRLIEGRLDDLNKGKRLTFSFLVPSRLEAYSFQATKVGEADVLGQRAMHVRLEPANLFIRWLAEGVEVFYHRETGQLLRYRGLSNLRDEAGENPRVQVDFPQGKAALPEKLNVPEEPDEPEAGPRVR